MRQFWLLPAILCLTIAPAAGALDARGQALAMPGPELAARSEQAILIMVDDPACHYCRRWHKEVGRGYPKTAEGKAAPLKRVSRDAGILSNFAPVVYTPTFILAQNGREVGRITGYPGQFYFWEELTQLISSAGISTKG